jgi:hypothetical protein
MTCSLASTLLWTLTACGSHQTDGDPAVWFVGSTDGLTPDSRAFDVVVLRVGCSGGLQGQPVKPVVQAGPSSIVITFRVTPHVTGAGTCIDTAGVPYRMLLAEPIGRRSLIDGECHPDSNANSTADCEPNGERLTWRDGQPRVSGG